MEISNVTQEYHLYIRKYVEVTPTMRGECLAPTADQCWLMRELNTIDRQIARKTRLLLQMQKVESEQNGDSKCKEHGEGNHE